MDERIRIGLVDEKQLKSFAWIMAAFFVLVLGLGPAVLKHGDPRVWALIVGGVFAAAGGFTPGLLKRPYQAWMFVGGILGWINTRIILGLIFFVLFTPIAVVRRLMGKDSLGLRVDAQAKTYRINLHSGDSFERQF